MLAIKEMSVNHKTSFGVKIKRVVYIIDGDEVITEIHINYSNWNRHYPNILLHETDFLKYLPGAKLKEHTAFSYETVLVYPRLVKLYDIIAYLREAFGHLTVLAEALSNQLKEMEVIE